MKSGSGRGRRSESESESKSERDQRLEIREQRVQLTLFIVFKYSVTILLMFLLPTLISSGFCAEHGLVVIGIPIPKEPPNLISSELRQAICLAFILSGILT